MQIKKVAVLTLALAFVAGLDIRDISVRVMRKLFRTLALRYNFSAQGLLEETESR